MSSVFVLDGTVTSIVDAGIIAASPESTEDKY